MTRNEKFTKDDLHSGYVVEFRNGERMQVARVSNFTKILIDTRGEAWFYLGSGWDGKLRAVPFPAHMGDMTLRVYRDSLREWDVMKVYGLIKSADNSKYRYALNTIPDHRPLLWERKEAVKLTVAEISKRLGYEVEIVADEVSE